MPGRFVTPSNSPTGSPNGKGLRGPDRDVVGRGVMRIGGGFSTDATAYGLMHDAENRAQVFRQQDGGMFNGALANHVDSRVRETQESHAFLLSRKNVDSVGVQYYENTSGARPPVAWPQMHNETDDTRIESQSHGSLDGRPASYQYMQQQPGAYVADDSVMSLDRPTMTSMNKTRIAKDHTFASSHHHTMGGGSPSRSRLHTSTVSAAARRLQKTAPAPLLDRTLHSVDGSCCNYNHPVQHSKVNGLFVTFCENNVETKLFNAIRDLDIEKNGREMDAKMHRQQLAAYLRQVEDLTKENEGLKTQLQKSTETHGEESSDLRKLKEEYERKYREQREEWETLSKKHSEMSAEHQELLATAGSRQNRIDELESELRGARATQLSSDKQLRDMGDRMTAAIAQSAVACDSREKLDQELRDLKLLFAAKEQIVDGLQRALREADEKINGIAILRDQVRSANRRK